MARKPRIHVPGGVYHAMLRGNGGQEVFRSDEDRLYFYDLVEEGVERFGHRIHGFCLMGNHLHLVVQVAEVPLSKIMQNLAFRYTRWFHRRTRSVGHLFQGRYKAILVDADAYLLALVRYVHLNPVRAGLVEQPETYPWSGHRGYLGLTSIPWLHTEWVLGQFAKRLSTCRKRYAAFVAAGLDEGHRDDFHRGRRDTRVLADDDFTAQLLGREPVAGAPPSLEAIVKTVCDHYEVTEDELGGPSRARRLSEARGVVGRLAVATRSTTLTEVATRFHRDPTTLCRIVARIDRQTATPSRLANTVELLRNTLAQA